MDNLIIVGAGGFGLEAAAYAADMRQDGRPLFAIKGFLDDTRPEGSRHAGYPVLGATDVALDPDALYIVAVGDPEGRQSLGEKLSARGAKFASILHPQSYVAANAQIGAGSVIAPFAFVGPEARIGGHCVLNVHASAGHESRMGDCCVLSPYAGTQGQVSLGTGVFLGGGACVTAGVKIGDGARISAGAVVYNDIPADALAIGNPARSKAA